MAMIAVLLPQGADWDALRAATTDHRLIQADDWRDLIAIVKREPAAAAVADLHAEPGKDGALRVLRFSRRYPRTPLLIWGDLDGRDLFRLGKAGAFDVVMAPDTGNVLLVSERVADATADPIARRVDRALKSRIGNDGRALVRTAAERIPDGIQVPTLADLHGFSVSTLERRCQEWGLTTPGRILLWLRIIYGLNWLTEPGRSVESVASQIGYSSGAAFRRAVKVTLSNGARSMREPESLDLALTEFVADCPGDPATASAGSA
ncbi:MAG: AraC family transcriptional regulator [Longimicrobiales bacterium]|nr:AraC family transcriptional regulator [Longimicrobiales bacterium]